MKSINHTRRRSALLLVGALAMASLVPVTGAAPRAHAAAPVVPAAAGNSGDIKIEGGQPDQGGQGNDQNDPHVACNFYIQGFNLAASRGAIQVNVWSPTSPNGDHGVVALSDTYTGTPDGRGTYQFVNGPYTLPAGHYKTFVTDNKGDEIAKQKVFWVDSCPATPPTATNTPVPPTATKTNTPVPPTATKTNTPIPPTATKTITPVPPTATHTPIPPCRDNSVQPRWSATLTAIAGATQTAIAAAPTCTPVPATATNTPMPPTTTNTPVPPTPTHTNTPVPPTATCTTPHTSQPAPTQTPVVVIKYQTATPPTPVTIIKYIPAPTSTPVPVSAVSPAHIKVVTKTRYKTRYKTRIKTRYHDVTRVKTQVRIKTVVRTVVRYKTITRVRLVTQVRTVVNHKVVYTTKVRRVTVVRYRTRVIVQHKTVIRSVIAYRYIHHPQTGRFASPAPAAAHMGSLPPLEARLSIARLGIRYAPVWARSFIANPDGSLRYDIVPSYGATRFSQSAPFGRPGLSLLSGHDDIYGSIFRYLGTMRRGDVIRVTEGRHVYQYVVRAVTVVTPDDVRLLNAPYTRPTLALISCTPYWVDTHRVVVIAQMI